MVQYRDLNAPPSRMLADVVADMKAAERQSKTGDAGVKDLGEAGDIVWPRPDGTPVSVRDVDLDLADARQRIEDAETSLGETGTRLTAAEQAVQEVRDDLAAIEVGEGGPLIHDRIPAPADGEGKPAGTAWLVYGQDGTLTSVWQWDGTVWEEMPLDAALIPVLDIGSGTFGDLTGARLVVDDTLAARVVQAMSAEVKELVVTEQAILNHATLIGQTVVDDINVQGKLVGTDGVFTGTVDFANVNVTGELLANEISGEHVYGTVIEGGEIRTGSDETRGSFLLGDRAYVSDFDGLQTPGIRFTPPDKEMIYPPGIGVDFGGLVISGGKALDNSRTRLEVNTGGVIATATHTESGVDKATTFSTRKNSVALRSGEAATGNAASINVGSSYMLGSLRVKGYAALSASWGNSHSEIRAQDDGSAVVKSGPNEFRVDEAGVWAKSGSDTVSLIPEVRPFQYSAQWNADQSPAPIMVQHLPGGKLCQAQIRIQNLTGSSLSLPNETWVTLNYNPIPSDLRGGFTDYIETTLPQASARGRVEMNYSTGRIRIRNMSGADISWTNNNSIWFPMRWFSPN